MLSTELQKYADPFQSGFARSFLYKRGTVCPVKAPSAGIIGVDKVIHNEEIGFNIHDFDRMHGFFRDFF